MIFETLWESAQRGELLLIDGGMCHWHLRRDKQITIREIISIRRGAGSEMLGLLRQFGEVVGATSIFAKCPADLDANGWYARRGFVDEGTEVTKSGRVLRLWRLALARPPQQAEYTRFGVAYNQACTTDERTNVCVRRPR